MSYNTELQSNNTDLRGILELVSSLPENNPELKRVEGTFTSSVTQLPDNPITINGIGFMPKLLVIAFADTGGYPNTQTAIRFVLGSALVNAFGDTITYHYTYRYTMTTSVQRLDAVMDNTSKFTITLLDDGFTLSSTKAYTCVPAGYPYYYLAVG